MASRRTTDNDGGGGGSKEDPRLHRIRENQRRSRARRREYLEDLEARWKRCQEMGVQADVELQRAARKVIEENNMLREILAEVGVGREEVDRRLAAIRAAGAGGGGGGGGLGGVIGGGNESVVPFGGFGGGTGVVEGGFGPGIGSGGGGSGGGGGSTSSVEGFDGIEAFDLSQLDLDIGDLSSSFGAEYATGPISTSSATASTTTSTTTAINETPAQAQAQAQAQAAATTDLSSTNLIGPVQDLDGMFDISEFIEHDTLQFDLSLLPGATSTPTPPSTTTEDTTTVDTLSAPTGGGCGQSTTGGSGGCGNSSSSGGGGGDGGPGNSYSNTTLCTEAYALLKALNAQRQEHKDMFEIVLELWNGFCYPAEAEWSGCRVDNEVLRRVIDGMQK